MCIQATGNAESQMTATNEFFGYNINGCPSDIAAASRVECFIYAYGLNNVRTEEIKRDILIFRVFGRKSKSIKSSCIVPVTQSTDKDIFHSVLFRHSGNFRHSTFCIRNTLAGKLPDTNRLYGNDCFLLFEQQHILIFPILLSYNHHIGKFLCIGFQLQIQYHQFSILHTHFTAHFGFIAYIFNLNIIHTFQNAHAVQFEITLHIGHCSGLSSEQTYRSSYQRFLG